MDLKDNSGKSSEGKEESWRESFHLFKEYIYHHDQNVGRNVDVKDHSGKVSDGNKDQLSRKWRKDYPCYKVIKNFVKIYVSVF